MIFEERKEQLELPEEALREAIINAIVHRDYFSTGHIQIDIFLDRIEISNPGGLVKGLAEKDFGKVSLPRNPLIMDLMLRINKVEKIGSGIGRIKDSMKLFGLGVKFESTGFFTVVLRRVSTPLDTPQVEFTELEKKMLLEIQTNPRISRNELAINLGISSDTVKEHIEKLKSKNAIRRIEKTSTGHWEILK